MRALSSVTEPQKVGCPESLQLFRDYEELSTLYDVLGRTEAGSADAHDKLVNFIPKIEKLRKNPSSAHGAELEAVIEFFSKLASEALYRARRPPEGISPGRLELCRKL